MADDDRELFAALGLKTCEDAARYFLGGQAFADGVTVARCSLQGRAPQSDIFFKQYHYPRASWRFLGRCSKAVREARNYAILRRFGLAVPRVICWGEERDGIGRLHRGIIATAAVQHSTTLPEYLANSRQAHRCERRLLLRALALQVGKLHNGGFYHHDLVGRNLLVSMAEEKPGLWWIDCPRGGYDRWSPLRRRKRLRDLAGLDKTGVLHCSKAERLRWFLDYTGASRLSRRHKRIIAEVTRYRLAH